MDKLEKVLNSPIISSQETIKLYYILYIMCCICICILIIYFFSLSIGIIKGTILSSNCNLESVEYESIRFQIYKTLLYFDKLLLFQILLGIILFLMLIVFGTFIYFIIVPKTDNYKFIISFIIWFVYFLYLISRSMDIYTNKTDDILTLLKNTDNNTENINGAIEALEKPSIYRDEIIITHSLYFGATFIYVIIIINYLLDAESNYALTMWIIVLSICYLLLLCVQTLINTFGNNFKNEYEQYIINLDKQFSKLLNDYDEQVTEADTMKYFTYKHKYNIWDYYMLLSTDNPVFKYTDDDKENIEIITNDNDYINDIYIDSDFQNGKINNTDTAKDNYIKCEKILIFYDKLRKIFNENFKKDFINVIRNLNGNCDRNIPNIDNKTYFLEKFPNDTVTGRTLEKFMDLVSHFEDKFKQQENLSSDSIKQLCLNNYNALHELKESELKEPSCIELFKVLYIPLFEHNTHKFEKNLEKLNVITKLDKEGSNIKLKLSNFNLIFNGIIKSEKKYFNYDIIQQISAGICFLIVFFICLVFYMLFRNIYTTGIIITIAIIMFSITILTIVRIISEGIH